MSKSREARPIPQINIQTGVITNGPIRLGGQFEWVNSDATSTCTVSAPPEELWFKPSPCIVKPSSEAAATAVLGKEQGWTYNVTGCPCKANARIPVVTH